MTIIQKYLESLNINDKKKVKIKMNVAGAIIGKTDENGQNQILIIQRSRTDHWKLYWEFPRGKCDKTPNEKIIPCLKREVKEEVGLDVIPIKFIDKYQYLADKGTRLNTQYNFLCTMKDPNQKIKLSKEHSDYRWISSVGEAELLMPSEMKKSISKILNIDMKIVNYVDDSEEKIEENLKISS